MVASKDKNTTFELIPNILSVSPDEFGLKWNDSNNRFEDNREHIRGISMVGFMMKNGWLKSDLDVENPFVKSDIYIDDAKLQTKQDTDQIKESAKIAKAVTTLNVEPTPKSDLTINEALEKFMGGDFDGFNKDDDLTGAPKIEINPTYTNKLAVDDARQWIGVTLGLSTEDNSLQIVDTVLDVTRAGGKVMGLSKIDCIILSTQGRKGI